MTHVGAEEQRQSEQITNWLLGFLRYVITLEDADRAAFLSAARDMDRTRSRLETPAFSFFTRTSNELCAAILSKERPDSHATLRRLFGNIDDSRLRRVLEEAIGLERPAVKREAKSSSRGYLWKGLRA